jgi:Uri superfamily endonuclease
LACNITYQLFIAVNQTVHITVGKLGLFEFPAGSYVYTGSARKNIDARIARHLRSDKKLRWHIDYLLACRFTTITKVIRSAEPECVVNQRVAGVVVVKGFGASDCRHRCGSHLKLLT